jgi:hypothetical protein
VEAEVAWVITDPEADWSDLRAQTKDTLIRERAALIRERDELRADNERLQAHVEGAEAVIGLGKAWWLARGHSRAMAEAAFEKAVAAYDPATWQT